MSNSTPTLRRVLTGVTTTGTPHLGNYVGAIRPAILTSAQNHVESYFFLADYHALIKCSDPKLVAQSRREVAATWLASGLDPDRVTFYRQSDIPEITELSWMLSCVTAKGMMNRAHAYKSAVEQNKSTPDTDEDAGITMGLFSYPVLMAADILLFNAHDVPVGRDQIQHIEMARDIAQRFNHIYGSKKNPIFTLPRFVVDENVAILPGQDGRKMSKSYHNIIPLFSGGAKATRQEIAKIITDSRLPGEPKTNVTGTALHLIYQAFSTPEETQVYLNDLEGGLGWGEAKDRLVKKIEQEIAPKREIYDHYIHHPDDVEDILQTGAAKARHVARETIDAVRSAVGLGQSKKISLDVTPKMK